MTKNIRIAIILLLTGILLSGCGQSDGQVQTLSTQTVKQTGTIESVDFLVSGKLGGYDYTRISVDGRNYLIYGLHSWNVGDSVEFTKRCIVNSTLSTEGEGIKLVGGQYEYGYCIID